MGNINCINKTINLEDYKNVLNGKIEGTISYEITLQNDE